MEAINAQRIQAPASRVARYSAPEIVRMGPSAMSVARQRARKGNGHSFLTIEFAREVVFYSLYREATVGDVTEALRDLAPRRLGKPLEIQVRLQLLADIGYERTEAQQLLRASRGLA
jgi:hypothetical protein